MGKENIPYENLNIHQRCLLSMEVLCGKTQVLKKEKSSFNDRSETTKLPLRQLKNNELTSFRNNEKLNNKQEKSLKTMISSKNPWHSLLVRKKDYYQPIKNRQKDSKRSKKLFVDLLEGEYTEKDFFSSFRQCINKYSLIFMIFLSFQTWCNDSM